jgi:hypothetical protein
MTPTNMMVVLLVSEDVDFLTDFPTMDFRFLLWRASFKVIKGVIVIRKHMGIIE